MRRVKKRSRGSFPDDWPCFFAAIHRRSEFTLVGSDRKALRKTAADLLRLRVEALSGKVNTVPADNCIRFPMPDAGGSAAPPAAETLARGWPRQTNRRKVTAARAEPSPAGRGRAAPPVI